MTEAKERSFIETGWQRLPAAAEKANLTAHAFRVLAHLNYRADEGLDPLDEFAGADACNMSRLAYMDALNELESRGIIIRKSQTDWELTDPEKWR